MVKRIIFVVGTLKATQTVKVEVELNTGAKMWNRHETQKKERKRDIERGVEIDKNVK